MNVFDYYKAEVKGFSNINVDYNEERNASIRDIKDDNSFYLIILLIIIKIMEIIKKIKLYIYIYYI